MKIKDEKIEKKENTVLNNIIMIILGLVAVVVVVLICNMFFFKNEYIDLNDPDLVETEDGYKKDVDFETIVDDKKIIKEKNDKKYVIICFKDDEEYEIEVGNYIYNNLAIDEEIRVYGTIHYNKKGLKLSYDYQVESLVDEDDNGIIDIPDGYKEPEPERVPGADYGDGIEW